jgi:hypothetical protein
MPDRQGQPWQRIVSPALTTAWIGRWNSCGWNSDRLSGGMERRQMEQRQMKLHRLQSLPPQEAPVPCPASMVIPLRLQFLGDHHGSLDRCRRNGTLLRSLRGRKNGSPATNRLLRWSDDCGMVEPFAASTDDRRIARDDRSLPPHEVPVCRRIARDDGSASTGGTRSPPGIDGH